MTLKVKHCILYIGGDWMIKLVGIGKYSRETVQMKDDIKQEKYDSYEYVK